jgi:hypothetical protein
VSELVMGICRVSVVRAVVGIKVRVMVQALEGARLLQFVEEMKLGVAVVGAAI